MRRAPKATSSASSNSSERAAVVGLAPGPREAAEASLDELARLTRVAGAVPVLWMLQERRRPDPARFFGRGKVEELARVCADSSIDIVIVDSELTPVQLRNLEGALGSAVVDRTQLILDIFARRARTREGKLQVELAQLRYLLPRLVGTADALSRLGGGIGTRGPGETKLETDRRRIRRRITTLTRQLGLVRRRRAQLRSRRTKQRLPTVALVGYTNAGKTTLFNRLTGDDAVVSDALFVTLDPLVRRLRLEDRHTVLCTDTVGFLDRLPHTLVAAFRATLEEVAEADLLLHICDASSPSKERQADAVLRVLREIGADEVPRLMVFNKCDLLDAAERSRLRRTQLEAVCLSAREPDCAELLRGLIARAVPKPEAALRRSGAMAGAVDVVAGTVQVP